MGFVPLENSLTETIEAEGYQRTGNLHKVNYVVMPLIWLLRMYVDKLVEKCTCLNDAVFMYV